MSSQWCKRILETAILEHGKPEIANTDQGSQYTSTDWIHFLEENSIQISMDGNGRALDNVWIERFWKSLKYNYIFLNPAEDGIELFERVQDHIGYYQKKYITLLNKHPMTGMKNSLNHKNVLQY